MFNPIRLLHFCIYLFYRAGTACLCALPIEWGFLAGRGVGACGYWLLPGLRRLARNNLEMAFEGEKTPAEIEAMAIEHFRRLGANLVSAVKLASMSEEEITSRVTCEIPAAVEALRQTRTGGWLAMISHIGNWEVFAHLGSIIPEYRIGAVYQPLGNAYIDAHFRETRARFGLKLFNRRRDLMLANRFLRDGGVLGVLVDQHAGDAGIWAPLFGRIASTSPLAASLATRANVPVLPIAIYTAGVARWRVVVSLPIEAPNDNPGQLTAEINRALEAQIRQSPEDWLWSHNRWKTPRPNFLLGYYHRGVAYPGGFDKKLKPFRILIVPPDDPAEAEASVEAVRAIKHARPDVEITILTNDALAEFWRSKPAVDRVAPAPRDATAGGLVEKIRALPRFDVAFLFTASRGKARAVQRAGVPRQVGHCDLRPFVNQVCRAQAHATRDENYYLQIAVEAGANPSRPMV
jgi:lauroyl/myristoyl acyltransferase